MRGEIRYQWDEAKRQSNLQTHGVDFADALLLDWSAALQIDHSRSGELRHLTYAPPDLRTDWRASLCVSLDRTKQRNPYHQLSQNQQQGDGFL